MTLTQIFILAVVQGLAELLPVSSSAHVILAQKLLGLDPGAPEMTFLLVMLHTGTMFAVLLYFAKRWKILLRDTPGFVKSIVIATACTGVLGLGLKIIIEKIILEKMLGHSKGEVEHLFRILPMIAAALLAAGLLILVTGIRETENEPAQSRERGHKPPQSGSITSRQSVWIGLIQGLCLPFRGFSRSGATISTGMVLGVPRVLAEEFSFALAVVITPPVIVLELRRLLKHKAELAAPLHLSNLLAPGMLGMFFSFLAGLVALKWLSSWLEKGRWKFFGCYCIAYSAIVLFLWQQGF